MKPVELKVARIGNSRGVRIPAATLARYHIGESVVMEEKTEGILLRLRGAASHKLSFLETAREMATSVEDWTEWDAADGDGLNEITWDTERLPRVAEREPNHTARRRSGAG
ncbi:MAG: hypothetical protein WKF55_03100 [Gemmatimonadaceae bacterium]